MPQSPPRIHGVSRTTTVTEAGERFTVLVKEGVREVFYGNRSQRTVKQALGLLVMSGVSGDGPHLIRSDDGKAALCCGAIDDLWQFGKPRGVGGPWKDTAVTTDKPSDPYLMTGYDKKTLTLSADKAVKVRVEVDITGTGFWRTWQTLKVATGKATAIARRRRCSSTSERLIWRAGRGNKSGKEAVPD